MLRAKEITGSDSVTISGYILYNIVFALMSYPMGYLADRIGMKKVFVSGLILFSIVYAGFAFNQSIVGVYLLFAIYGIYAASTEGIAKAWISNMAHDTKTATALGFFNSVQSLATFLQVLFAGLIWMSIGSRSMFLFSVDTCPNSFYLPLLFHEEDREKYRGAIVIKLSDIKAYRINLIDGKYLYIHSHPVCFFGEISQIDDRSSL